MKRDLCSCGNIKDARSKHCSKCYTSSLTGVNSLNYKHGKTLKKYYCKCGNEMTYRAIHCRICSNIEKSERQMGENNSNYGNIRIPSKYCIDCGNELKNKNSTRCWKCYCEWSKIPENNPNYVHGKCYEPYPLGWNRTFKEQIRYRDNYKCQICGCHEVENCRKLDVHHIDYNKKNLKENNLISLCLRCHMKTNFNREYWYEKLKEYNEVRLSSRYEDEKNCSKVFINNGVSIDFFEKKESTINRESKKDLNANNKLEE